MEREIEEELNSMFYLHIIVKPINFRSYAIKIKELEKSLIYTFNYNEKNFEDNITEIEMIICEEIIKYYKKK